MQKRHWLISWAWIPCGLIVVCALFAFLYGERRAAAIIGAQALIIACLTLASLQRKRNA